MVFRCTLHEKWHFSVKSSLYSMKHQVIMRDLCWISCFCCFSVKSAVSWISWKAQCFSWKAQCFSVKSAVSWKAQLHEKRSAFQWKAQLREKHSAFQWKALKSATLFNKVLWGFGLSPSIGLSYIYERPNIVLSCKNSLKKATSSLGGLKPPTFRLTAERANRLRHRDQDNNVWLKLKSNNFSRGWQNFFICHNGLYLCQVWVLRSLGQGQGSTLRKC